MTNKFVGWLETVGRDFKKALPWIETTGEAAVAEFVPGLGPLFNSTVSAVALAEQKYAALGKQSGSGEQKLADVLQLMSPVIAQGLADIGKPNDETAVAAYINSVVAVLNVAPPPTTSAVVKPATTS